MHSVVRGLSAVTFSSVCAELAILWSQQNHVDTLPAIGLAALGAVTGAVVGYLNES
jgi:hypothetical protein